MNRKFLTLSYILMMFMPQYLTFAQVTADDYRRPDDLVMWWNEQWMGWPVGEEYAQSSNVENAWRLKGKLLLINGEMDNNVDPSSTMQFINALIKGKKEFEYLFLPWLKHTNGGVYGKRRRRDFFVKNLLGVDPPDWNMLEK